MVIKGSEILVLIYKAIVSLLGKTHLCTGLLFNSSLSAVLKSLLRPSESQYRAQHKQQLHSESCCELGWL